MYYMLEFGDLTNHFSVVWKNAFRPTQVVADDYLFRHKSGVEYSYQNKKNHNAFFLFDPKFINKRS